MRSFLLKLLINLITIQTQNYLYHVFRACLLMLVANKGWASCLI